MNLSTVPILSTLGLGASFCPLEYLGLNQQPVAAVHEAVSLASGNSYINALPPGFEQLSVSYVRNNLAVIPGDWEAGSISQNTSLILAEPKLTDFQKHPSTTSNQTSSLSKMP